MLLYKLHGFVLYKLTHLILMDYSGYYRVMQAEPKPNPFIDRVKWWFDTIMTLTHLGLNLALYFHVGIESCRVTNCHL